MRAADPVDVQFQKNPVVERAFVSFRISPNQWMHENRYGELLALFEKHKGATDEIAFFTSFTHAPLPIDEVRRRCEILAQRISKARSLGYRAGINVLTTIGHHEENLPNSLSGDYTPVTDVAGNVSRGSFCPNDSRFHTYVGELYRAVAAAKPDFVWIDDDVRLNGHLPVGRTCFCDRCLEVFEKESGKKYARTELAAALERQEVRMAWLEHNRATIERLLTLIEGTVHGVTPGLPLGFMTGERFFEGYDFPRWAKALAGPSGAPVMWRPGGGFYEDSSPGGLMGKSHEIGRQVSLLPRSVVSIQSEIENFPYQAIKKAANITVLEAASHMGAGCTGAAFNVLSGNDEPLDEFEPLVARIRRARPFYDRAARHLGRAEPVGVFAAWNIDAAAADFNGAWGYLAEASPLLEIGLPAAYNPHCAAVTLLFGPSLATMSNDEITKTLTTAVYMDAATLAALNQRGFQELTGLAVETPLPIDCIEEFTAHPLNGPFAGRQRDCRQSFYHGPSCSLKKINLKAETLARLVDYGGKEKAAIGMAIFENRLGGRICVGGYYPWSLLHSLSKSAQMKAVARWLSRDRLPAYVASYHKINLWARPSEDEQHSGCLAILLVNASFDPADGLELSLLTPLDEITVVDMDDSLQVVRKSGTDGPYRRFTLPCIEPWQARLVIAGEGTK